MIGVAHADRGDAMGLGALDRLPRGARRQHLTHAVVAVDHGEPTGVDDKLRLRHGIAHARLQTRDIPGKPHHAMRLMSPQISLHQGVRCNRSIRRGHAD
jgi:hypothetical protein